MLVGVIDGDGYIAITKAHLKDNISLTLVISVELADSAMLYYFQSVLRIGIVKEYPSLNTVKYIINRTDLQEVFFPLLLHHNMFFLTYVRQLQFNKAMHILSQSVVKFSLIPTEMPFVT